MQYGYWQLNPGPPEEHRAFMTTDPVSPAPKICLIIRDHNICLGEYNAIKFLETVNSEGCAFTELT